MTERQFLKLDLTKSDMTQLMDCMKFAFNKHKEWYHVQKKKQEETGLMIANVGGPEWHLHWMKFYKQLIDKLI